MMVRFPLQSFFASPGTQTADEIKRWVKKDEVMFAETNLLHEEYDEARVECYGKLI